MSNIFISYSRKDSDCVYAVVDELKQQSFSLWVDLEAIQITDEWLNKIEQAIKSAKVFMLFWSANALESNYVKHEMRIAKQLLIHNQIKTVVVMLDETKLPFDHIQAHNMKSGCSPIAIKKFVNTLPSEWCEFSSSKTLGEQRHTVVRDNYVSVLYDAGEECKAYIVGKKDEKLPAKPKELGVALQFFRPTNADIFDSVLNSLPSPDTWILHITGPTLGDNYVLDNENPVQWETSRKFIVENIQKVGHQASTNLHFYTLTPNALLGGVTMPLYRFWHVYLYNFLPPQNKYVPVIDIPRS